LVHRVVEAQIGRRQPAGLEFVTDIAGAEHAGREADESVERNEHDVEIVDQQVGAGRGMRRKQQRQRREQSQERGGDIQPRGQAITGQQRQQRRGPERDQNHPLDPDEGEIAHRRSPRNWSSAARSTLSKRSRMRNRKMPMTMKAIRTEKATLISTTSGMPLAPVAARIRPFSSDMN